MSRSAIVVAILLVALGGASPSEAQRKQKDPVLHQYLVDEFAQLNAKLERLAERLAAAEAELGRVRQSQADLLAEVRGTQTTVKTVDAGLSTFRLSTQQDLLSLKTDLTQLRQDVIRLSDAVKGVTTPAAPPAAPPAAEPAAVDGYITAVSQDEKEVNISLGGGAGLKVGTELGVFKSGDPKTRVGIVEVIEVIDANNSRAKVVYVQPSVKLEFSDIVRPRT